MLQIIQWEDKLAAMWTDFAQWGMLSGGHTLSRRMSHLLKTSLGAVNREDEDGGPVEDLGVLGHVTLAQTCSRLIYLLLNNLLISGSTQLSLEY